MQAQQHPLTKPPPSYSYLAQLLGRFLTKPSLQIQKQLSLFPYNLYLQVISNINESQQIRMAACSSLKAVVSQRQRFQPHWQKALTHIQQIYFRQPTPQDPKLQKLQQILQITISKILQMYLDDEKKINLYIAAMQRIYNGAHLSKCKTNRRIINLLKLLIRSLHYLSLNNQVLIGELVLFMKNLFIQQPPLNEDIWIAKGNGLQIIRLLLSEDRDQFLPSNQTIQAFIRVVVGILTLMQQIVEIVNMDNQQDENVPSVYIQNSASFKSIFPAILSISCNGCMITKYPALNLLKVSLLQLYREIFVYYADESMLDICLSTLWQHRRQDLCDQGQEIMLSVVVMLSRSVNHPDYWKVFHAGMQPSILKLVDIIAARLSQIQLIESDPQQFIAKADDFCLQQEQNSLKVRAGALIAEMGLCIDGFVSYVYNFLSVPLMNIERSCYQAFKIESPPVNQQIQRTIRKLLQLSQCNVQEFTQSAILIISSISDQFQKRPQIYTALVSHGKRMVPIFFNKEEATKLMSPLIICRYIQFVSYFPFENCLDVFLPYYSLKKVYAQALIKALQTIIRVHDKKDRDMRAYVSKLSQNLLLMSSTLTPLLQEMIINKSNVMICVRDRVLEKLVGWMLEFYAKKSIVGCNKISNLIIHLIRQYQSECKQTQVESSQYFQPVDYNSMMIWEYLFPLYKYLDSQTQHPAEQCLVEIVVSHIEYLIAAKQMDLQKALTFYNLGVKVVERNNGVLNSCIQLLGKIITHGNHNKDVASKLIVNLGNWMDQSKRESDLWEILHLTEVCALVIGRQSLDLGVLKFPFLIQYCQTCPSDLLRLKIILLFLSIQSISPSTSLPFFSILDNMIPPAKIPVYQIRSLIIYYMRVINLFQKQEYRWFLVDFIIKGIQKLQNKQLIKNYEQDLYCSGEQNEAEINAYHKSKQVEHPLSSTDIYEEFREMIKHITNKDNIVHLSAQLQEKIKSVILKHRISGQTRKVIKVKRNE